jgi:hypothetical protein
LTSLLILQTFPFTAVIFTPSLAFTLTRLILTIPPFSAGRRYLISILSVFDIIVPLASLIIDESRVDIRTSENTEIAEKLDNKEIPPRSDNRRMLELELRKRLRMLVSVVFV